MPDPTNHIETNAGILNRIFSIAAQRRGYLEDSYENILKQAFTDTLGETDGPLVKESEAGRHTAKKLFELTQLDQIPRIINFNVGPCEDPILLVEEGDQKNCKIIHVLNGNCIEISVAERPWKHCEVQPLPNDTYLLAGARAQKGVLNAFVVSKNGQVIERFRFDDAIEMLQATAEGNIWVCYFDEGSYYNVAVACFNRHGGKLYPVEKNDFGAECLALNVESERIIYLDGGDGDIVKFEDHIIVKRWPNLPDFVGGSFAIFNDTACWGLLMEPFAIHDFCSGQGYFFYAVDDHGERLKHSHCAGRGSKMFFLSNRSVYVLDIEDLVKQR